MNLLNKIFNYDDIEITIINKKYSILLIGFIVIILLLVLIKKDNYYSSTFTYVDKSLVLLVDKDYVNEIRDNKQIIIDDINYDYSINSIEPFNDYFLISIETKLKNINNGIYKIHLGKESVFDYIVRIIIK